MILNYSNFLYLYRRVYIRKNNVTTTDCIHTKSNFNSLMFCDWIGKSMINKKYSERLLARVLKQFNFKRFTVHHRKHEGLFTYSTFFKP